MLSSFLIFSVISSIIFASIPYDLTCGTPQCLDYNDGCNDYTCNIKDGTVAPLKMTQRACFAAGTPICRKCQKGAFWLRYNTFQPPGFPTCDSRFIKSPLKLENNSKCACPKEYPFWKEGVGCINNVACDADVIHTQDTLNYLKFFRKPASKKCLYDYKLCTSDIDCPQGLICNIAKDNYETCVPLSARLNRNCELKDCRRCLFDDCMGSSFGYCSISTDCTITGCSGQICTASYTADTQDKSIAGVKQDSRDISDVTICEFTCEHQCLQYQQCGRVGNKGICGWKTKRDKKSRILYRQCMRKCKQTNKPISTVPFIPNEDACKKSGQCYNERDNVCGDYAACPKRDYCSEEIPPKCNAYPDAECKFTACDNCDEYFVDFYGNVIKNCNVNKCTLPMEIGPCEAAMDRYYYDLKRKQCATFSYGGCHGNANNFGTLEECQKACVDVKDICLLAKETGPCKARFTKYYYNGMSGQCEQFNYGGCKGNQNNFDSLAECQHRCDSNIPDCVAGGYSFFGDISVCQTIKVACPEGWEFWSDFVCGCGCKPT